MTTGRSEEEIGMLTGLDLAGLFVTFTSTVSTSIKPGF